MRDFKFFQKEESHVRNRMFSDIIERLQTENERLQDRLTDNARDYWDGQRQVYEPLRISQMEQRVRERTINDALRHEEYLHSLQVRGESVVDYGQLGREIREQARLRSMVTMSIERPNELLHRGRRPRNPY